MRIFLLNLVQVEAFLKSMQRIIQIGGRRSFFGKRLSVTGRERFTLEDMLSYQRVSNSVRYVLGIVSTTMASLFHVLLSHFLILKQFEMHR